MPSVVVRPVGPCDVIWYGNWGGALVLGCPHMDLLKFWPLPVQQPWYEDSIYPPGTAQGEKNGRSSSESVLRDTLLPKLLGGEVRVEAA